MRINWKARLKNKAFWVVLIPSVLIAVKAIADLFGIAIDVTELSEKLIRVVTAVFSVLTILGVVVDPTTEGINDSDRAMTYDRPA
jgi:phi LC3 family holin